MQLHLDKRVTSLASCVAIERRDGARLFFTDHDQDIDLSTDTPFTGRFNWLNTTYLAQVGFTRTAIQSAQANIDNAELEAILNSVYVNEDDLRAGLYDNARVYHFIVNWNDLSLGVVRMAGSGWLGEVTLNIAKGTYTAELRGLGQAFSRRIGDTYQPGCRTDVFSRKCGLDDSAFVQYGVVTAVTSNREFDANYTPAGFSSTALTITNPSFDDDASEVDDPNITGWTGVDYQTLGQWEATSAGSPGPTDGARHLTCHQSTPHDLQRWFTIISDAVTIPTGGGGPSTANIDAGLVLIELNVDISLDAGTKDEARLGVIWLDALGAEIGRVRAPDINRVNHSFNEPAQTYATFTRQFIAPPNARSFNIELAAINLEGDICEVQFDNLSGTAENVVVLTLGTDRDSGVLSDWFDNGLIIFRSGENIDRALEVNTYTSIPETIETYLPFPETVAVGDVFEIYPGCKKRWTEDCATKWDNAVNFQGEPFVPSQDEAFRSIDAK